jgi:hypothetical protein
LISSYSYKPASGGEGYARAPFSLPPGKTTLWMPSEAVGFGQKVPSTLYGIDSRADL